MLCRVALRWACQAKMIKSTANDSVTSQSRLKTSESKERGPNNPGTGSTISRLKILLPTIAPKAMSACPFTALITDAANSGRLVPMATMVKPTISSDTPREVAILTAPITSTLDEMTSSVSPPRNLSQATPADVEVGSCNSESWPLSRLDNRNRKTVSALSKTSPSKTERLPSIISAPANSVAPSI